MTVIKRLLKSLLKKNNWDYEEIEGSNKLLMKLLNEDWNDKEFLIVPPNKTIKPSYNDDIICLSEI